MAVTTAAAWLVASSGKRQRNAGFWVFLLSNVLWVIWGLHAHAPALIVMQVLLAAMNTRGAIKTRRDESARGEAGKNGKTVTDTAEP